MRTDTAELVLAIAQRILHQRDIGWPVDPSRIAWAEQVITGNAPTTPQKETSHA